MKQKWQGYTFSMQGFLDDQFTQLQMLQDESNPDFVAEVINLFAEDSERLLSELTKALYVFINFVWDGSICHTFCT